MKWYKKGTKHFDDVIETILMEMLYVAQMQTMMPKLHSTFHEGMELIRPLYYVKEADIIRWKEMICILFNVLVDSQSIAQCVTMVVEALKEKICKRRRSSSFYG